MSPLLILAMAAITLALVFYTIGVFAERHSGELMPRHVLLFWLGFACDTTGTTVMTVMAHQAQGTVSPLHAITGAIAIVLMLFHAVWATVVLVRNNPKQRENFHRLSIGVWLFWLIPYCIGMLMGVPMLHLNEVQASVGGIAIVAVVAAALWLASRRSSSKKNDGR